MINIDLDFIEKETGVLFCRKRLIGNGGEGFDSVDGSFRIVAKSVGEKTTRLELHFKQWTFRAFTLAKDMVCPYAISKAINDIKKG